MKSAAWGTIAVLALVVGASAGWVFTAPADAQRPTRDAAVRGMPGEGLVALPADVDERRQQVTLIDPQMRTMVVYHIDKSTGEVSLRSVRNIHWDLQMDEFNGKSPLPREIRSLLQPRP
jgi:hypothetical protein